MLIGISALELENSASALSELTKYQEETKEFKDAVLNEDEENAIEEYYDVIQTMTQTLLLLGVNIDKLKEGQYVYRDKLKGRGWKLKEL